MMPTPGFLSDGDPVLSIVSTIFGAAQLIRSAIAAATRTIPELAMIARRYAPPSLKIKRRSHR
jgi:hypothetical protein